MVSSRAEIQLTETVEHPPPIPERGPRDAHCGAHARELLVPGRRATQQARGRVEVSRVHGRTSVSALSSPRRALLMTMGDGAQDAAKHEPVQSRLH